MISIAMSTLDRHTGTYFARLLDEQMQNVEQQRSSYVFNDTVKNVALLRKQVNALRSALLVSKDARKTLEERQSMLLPATENTPLHQAKVDLNKVISAVFYEDAEKAWEDTWLSGDPLWNS